MDRTRLSRLVVFTTVAREGSFRAAAERLRLAPSAISHAVGALEASLGVRLLARSTRSLRLTPEGERLLEATAAPLAEIDSGFAALAELRAEPSGPLRVTMPLLVAEDVIAPHLGAFARSFPKVELEIRTDDHFEDIVASGFDAGIRLGESLEDTMIAVPLGGRRRGRIVATPEYFQRQAAPLTPHDLLSHPCIRRRFSSGQIYAWELEKDGRKLVIDPKGPLILSHQGLIHRAVLQGVGLAYIFQDRVIQDIAAGLLVPVLDDWTPVFEGFYLYYPSRRHMRPALRAFIDFFREATRPAAGSEEALT
ncbi:LysR family transcriptional regulator [Pararhodospirillum oryzae]|uniref:LysR family transcriptional regulator n=1 Tax=Pararhodospirillum oryzae TaxID=478448 RepID=A0A512H6H7_9PROT|nr:LysR family transcriptional regulator [Pararhodospirillum oryzae]GEO81066.1 LysR family transcriptional regulator [Pararhodospirillum oryzae]